MPAHAKICGLTTPEAVKAAVAGGAAYVGFVMFPRSPRHIEPEAAAGLAEMARAGGAKVVAVTVDASDAEVDRIAGALRPDLIQLHGNETPDRALEVRRRSGAGVVRAFGVGAAADLDKADAFAEIADHLMFDARPPAEASRPGGVGAAFDWSLLAGRRFERPWFLAGGLTPSNVAEAVAATGAPIVDVSSGVETEPGCKDPRLITAFLDAVRRA